MWSKGEGYDKNHEPNAWDSDSDVKGRLSSQIWTNLVTILIHKIKILTIVLSKRQENIYLLQIDIMLTDYKLSFELYKYILVVHVRLTRNVTKRLKSTAK